MSFVSLAAATQTRIASEPVIANKKWPLHNRALKKMSSGVPCQKCLLDI